MQKKRKKPWPIFIAIILAVIIGSWSGTKGAVFGITLYPLYDFFGTIFIKALTLIVVPLVSSSIITGIARIGGDTAFKRIGSKTFGFYIITSLLAILIGLLFVNLIHPGRADLVANLQQAPESLGLQKQIAADQSTKVVDI